MGSKTIRGNRVLTGSYAEIWINGILCAECEKIEAKITVNREDVKLGADIDSKMTGLKGEGSMTIHKVYTRFEDVRKAYMRGEDVRSEIMAKLADPDAIGKQAERYSIQNVWFNELPLINWERGAMVKEEVSFGFTASDLQNLDRIDIQ